MSDNLKPFTRSTKLTDYMPVPRQLINMHLPSTAVLLYSLLLDRATLSQKNNWCDDSGEVYVIFTVEHLAEVLDLSQTTVKINLRILSDAGLIRRERPVKNSVNHIYLYIPMDTNFTVEEEEIKPPDGRKSTSRTGKIIDDNNRKKQRREIDDYYSYSTGESI